MLPLIICIVLAIVSFIVFLLISTNETSVKTKKLTAGINKLLLFAPIIAAIILTILFFTILKGRLVERTSHALIVLCLWLYATAFYVNVLKYFKNKVVLIINIVLMLISAATAIYLTPLDRYFEVMFSFTQGWAYLIGAFMLIILYFELLQKENDEFERNPKDYVLNNSKFLIEKGYEFKHYQLNGEEEFIFSKDDIAIIIYYEWKNKIDAAYERKHAGEGYIYEDQSRFNIRTLVENSFDSNFETFKSKNKIDYLLSIFENNLDKIEKLSKIDIINKK